jgi:hypothetical protein
MAAGILSKIINQGVGLNSFDNKSRRVVYSNIIYVSLPIVYLIFVGLEYDTYLGPIQDLDWDHFVFIVEIIVCLIGIHLNRIGQSLVGRLLFLISWPILLHILPIWHQQTPSDYYLAFPLGILFHAVLIQLMISIRQERFVFYLLIAANFILLLQSVRLLTFFEDSLIPEIGEMVNDDIFLLDVVLYWLLFSVMIYFLMRAIDEAFEIISRNQELIHNQKEELAAINEELVQSNESLHELNKQTAVWNEQLEFVVRQRTREIEIQNDQLRSYAYFNAHKLNAPFCRIKGLIMLRDLTDEQGIVEIDSLLGQSVQELDLVIQEIQQIVNESDKSNGLRKGITDDSIIKVK